MKRGERLCVGAVSSGSCKVVLLFRVQFNDGGDYYWVSLLECGSPWVRMKRNCLLFGFVQRFDCSHEWISRLREVAVG